MREKSPGAAFAGSCWSCCCCCNEDASADGDAKKLPADGATTADMARARALRMAPIVAALGDAELRLLLLPMAVAVVVAVAVAVLVLLVPVADEPVVAPPPDADVGDNRGAAAAFDADAAEPN